MEVIVDSDAMLQIMFTAYDSLEVTVFEVTILSNLRPDLPLGGILQALLHTFGIHISAKQIAWVNENGNELPPRIGGIYGPQTNLAENVWCETDVNEDESPYTTEGRDRPQTVRNKNV